VISFNVGLEKNFLISAILFFIQDSFICLTLTANCLSATFPDYFQFFATFSDSICKQLKPLMAKANQNKAI